jgi:16S rRNA (adenine1518-N6/adenine1519-N6)-dimethyltransferase
MSLLEKTKLLLRSHRIFPNRLFGQNFLVDSSFFESLSSYSSLSRVDTVLDVGSGLGFLTRFLADRCREVLAVEADEKLVAVLRGQLRAVPNVRIIQGNVLKVDVPRFNKVVSVPPYGISSRLILWLCQRRFDCSVMILQEEFANRLNAQVGSRDYGWLAVFAYYHADVEVFERVPKSLFYPEPKVGSVIVRLTPKRPAPFALKDEDVFRQLTKSLFTERNRKVRNALVAFMRSTRRTDRDEAAQKAEALPFGDRRVRELAPEDFGVLANALCK